MILSFSRSDEGKKTYTAYIIHNHLVLPALVICSAREVMMVCGQMVTE